MTAASALVLFGLTIPIVVGSRRSALLALVDDEALVRARFVDPAMSVQGVQFIADLPVKHRQDRPAALDAPAYRDAASIGLRALIANLASRGLLRDYRPMQGGAPA